MSTCPRLGGSWLTLRWQGQSHLQCERAQKKIIQMNDNLSVTNIFNDGQYTVCNRLIAKLYSHFAVFPSLTPPGAAALRPPSFCVAFRCFSLGSLLRLIDFAKETKKKIKTAQKPSFVFDLLISKLLFRGGWDIDWLWTNGAGQAAAVIGRRISGTILSDRPFILL